MSVAAAVHGGILAKRRWTPRELGTLSLWLDADDATTITESSGAVSQWRDKSGNGRNMNQTTSGNQPSYVTNVQNGGAVVRFDGSDKFMAAGNILNLGTGGMSIGVAVSATTGEIVAKANNLFTANGSYALRQTGFSVYINNTTRTSSITSTANWQVIAGVLDRNASVIAYQDGTAATADTNGFPDTASWSNTVQLFIGARNTLANPTGDLNGDIAEVVLSQSTWATDERQKVEGYLAWKWGLVGSLPAGHPYKNIQP